MDVTAHFVFLYYSKISYALAALLLGRPLDVSSEVSRFAEFSCCGGVSGTVSFFLLLAGVLTFVFALGCPGFFLVSSVLHELSWSTPGDG